VQALAERTVTDAFGHAEHLMPLVQDALAGAEAGLADLAAIVVGLGPGPFTGLRVGIATAQALGDALSVPVHGIPSHDGVALAATDPSSTDPTWADQVAPFLIATDARRREVYLSGYSGGVRRAGPLVAAPADVAIQLPDGFTPAWIAGAGAGLLAGALGLPVREIVGSVSQGLVRAALRQLLTGAIPGPLAPLYLRRPDATVPGAPKPVLGLGVTR
jgi:tRNA threonylcarbamoyl adenosine modification protein YeaZ